VETCFLILCVLSINVTRILGYFSQIFRTLSSLRRSLQSKKESLCSVVCVCVSALKLVDKLFLILYERFSHFAGPIDFSQDNLLLLDIRVFISAFGRE
jgi:hypothetical protein